jgi:hypothetical protein
MVLAGESGLGSNPSPPPPFPVRYRQPPVCAMQVFSAAMRNGRVAAVFDVSKYLAIALTREDEIRILRSNAAVQLTVMVWAVSMTDRLAAEEFCHR